MYIRIHLQARGSKSSDAIGQCWILWAHITQNNFCHSNFFPLCSHHGHKPLCLSLSLFVCASHRLHTHKTHSKREKQTEKENVGGEVSGEKLKKEKKKKEVMQERE